ncbi:hypothetical protein Trydic_g19040 [Trypoxylus dichotomus]
MPKGKKYCHKNLVWVRLNSTDLIRENGAMLKDNYVWKKGNDECFRSVMVIWLESENEYGLSVPRSTGIEDNKTADTVARSKADQAQVVPKLVVGISYDILRWAKPDFLWSLSECLSHAKAYT